MIYLCNNILLHITYFIDYSLQIYFKKVLFYFEFLQVCFVYYSRYLHFYVLLAFDSISNSIYDEL